MKRRLLTAVAAVLVVWGGIFYGYPSTWDDDLNDIDFE